MKKIYCTALLGILHICAEVDVRVHAREQRILEEWLHASSCSSETAHTKSHSVEAITVYEYAQQFIDRLSREDLPAVIILIEAVEQILKDSITMHENVADMTEAEKKEAENRIEEKIADLARLLSRSATQEQKKRIEYLIKKHAPGENAQNMHIRLEELGALKTYVLQKEAAV